MVNSVSEFRFPMDSTFILSPGHRGQVARSWRSTKSKTNTQSSSTGQKDPVREKPAAAEGGWTSPVCQVKDHGMAKQSYYNIKLQGP